MAKPLELLLKRFSFFESSCFFSIFNSPARPSAEFGLVDLRKLVVFCDFQIARATLCGVSRGRIALVVARRYLNRCQASGICTNAN